MRVGKEKMLISIFLSLTQVVKKSFNYTHVSFNLNRLTRQLLVSSETSVLTYLIKTCKMIECWVKKKVNYLLITELSLASCYSGIHGLNILEAHSENLKFCLSTSSHVQQLPYWTFMKANIIVFNCISSSICLTIHCLVIITLRWCSKFSIFKIENFFENFFFSARVRLALKRDCNLYSAMLPPNAMLLDVFNESPNQIFSTCDPRCSWINLFIWRTKLVDKTWIWNAERACFADNVFRFVRRFYVSP